MKNLFNFPIDNSTFYKLSNNVSNSSEYGGNTLNNIAEGKPWATCYQQLLNYFRICKYITKKEEIVLDIGCGQAELLTVIRSNRKGNKYIGIEIEKNNLKKSKQFFRNPNREILLEHDVTLGLPLKDNTIDIVTCNLLLEHLPKDKSLFVFQELKRVCKKSGLILIMMPIREEGKSNSQPKHVYEWTLKDINEQIEKNSLICIEKYICSCKIKDIRNSNYNIIYKKLQGKIHPIFIRQVLAPLLNTGTDIFLKLKKV